MELGEKVADKDYYDILGVRQNAARDEIELAYKGRRTQYHPDRYSQSDVETLAWATSKMQAVNEAYQVLDSADLRAEFDRRRSSDVSTRSKPERQDATSAQEVNEAASVLLKPEWSWSYDKVYARPNIPYKKLEGAIC
ncbi:MAG: DnaJ domain-containing protein, partial [Burkholderiaceae bacterium]